MKFIEQYTREINTNLRPLEITLKKLYKQNQNRDLELPHKIEDCKDILTKASLMSENLFPQILSNTLEEDLFFHENLDCEIYMHLRYLPCNWHSHSFLEIVCVMKGSCINYILEQKIEMKAGDICIIAPDTRHAISAFSDDSVIFNLILRTSTFETAFFGTLSENDVLSDFFMRSLYNSKTHPYLLFRTGGDSETFNYVGFAYEEYSGNRQYKNRMLNSIINAFFIILLRNHGNKVIVPELGDGDKEQNLIYILKYMQEHFCTVTLKELSVFFNYSERQIQRIIKTSTGMSFSENIQKLKMNRAARLLANPDLSVTAIAEELGYADAGNFRYIFKKYYSITPVEFRSKIS
ncbi:AraC family transcriptional regulator [Mediterraneibacter agrestimuris]|uniref:AraC family transcriptional regulator n=1 Tax=Mediterraneibacter agrestimuris TaxID=2941333 RepID=UPI00203B70FD|nr:AraC family transcriptional regulator [Mediterraneibacter agrestimuris]